LKKYKEANYYG
jgi:hypothetical protein